MKTPVRDQVNNLSTEAFLTRLATLMKDNPPAEADKPIVEKMAKIGLSPGKAFDINRLKGGATAVESVPKDALGKIVEAFKGAQGDQRVAVHHRYRHVRDELPAARHHHLLRPRRQPAAGRDLSDLVRRRRWTALRRRQPPRCTSRRAAAAGERVLVVDDV